MKDVVIWDLDGTLSDGRHRLHLLPSKDKAHRTEAWFDFNKAASSDLPILDNISLMNLMFRNGMKVIILTGRSDHVIEETQKWLYDNGCCYHRLIMRSKHDHRKDTEYKEEMLNSIGLDRILCCFDDLEHVAKHMRSLGLTCHLVTHYEEKRIDTISHEERELLK